MTTSVEIDAQVAQDLSEPGKGFSSRCALLRYI